MSHRPPHRLEHTVRFAECGPHGRATIKALGDYLQQTAHEHSQTLAFSVHDMAEQGLAWMLARLHVAVTEYPAMGQRLGVDTWPAACDKYRMQRDFLVHDADGRVIARAAQHWTLLDLNRGRVISTPDSLRQLLDGFPPPATSLPEPAPAKLATGQRQAPVTPRRTDLDLNGHVNNAHFLAWLMEALPPELAELPGPREVDLVYRRQCLWGRPVQSLATPGPEAGLWLHGLWDGEEKAELARAATRW